MAEKAEISQIAKKLTEELLSKTGVDAKVEVEDTPDGTKVNIIGEDLGILIGFHGETLKAIQTLLGVMVNHEKGDEDWSRILVDVGSWRESRQTSLEEMAQNAVNKALESKLPCALPPLSPDERRLVHMYLQEQVGVSSHSEGEGSERHIVVLPE